MYTLLIFWYLFVIRWGSFMIKIWSHRMTMFMKQLYCSASFLQHIYFYRWYITFGLITLICNLKYKAYIVQSVFALATQSFVKFNVQGPILEGSGTTFVKLSTLITKVLGQDFRTLSAKPTANLHILGCRRDNV